MRFFLDKKPFVRHFYPFLYIGIMLKISNNKDSRCVHGVCLYWQ